MVLVLLVVESSFPEMLKVCIFMMMRQHFNPGVSIEPIRQGHSVIIKVFLTAIETQVIGQLCMQVC